MKSPAEENPAAICRERGIRITGPQRIILQVLTDTSDHPGAVELHRRMTAIDPGFRETPLSLLLQSSKSIAT